MAPAGFIEPRQGAIRRARRHPGATAIDRAGLALTRLRDYMLPPSIDRRGIKSDGIKSGFFNNDLR
jgi:hypothetical protein